MADITNGGKTMQGKIWFVASCLFITFTLSFGLIVKEKQRIIYFEAPMMRSLP